MASRILRRLRDLTDITWPGSPTDGHVLTYDSGTDKLVLEAPTGGGGASDAEDVAFAPAGSLSATDVQAALEELDDEVAARGAYVLVAPAPSGDTTGATDTAAIQGLIDDAASGDGGTVQLRAGTYYVTGLIGGNMVTLRGAGWRTRVRAVAGITVPVIGTPVSGVIYGFEVRDLCVYGARASTSSDCINFDLSASGQPQYSAVGMPDSVCRVINCLILYAGRDGISIGGPDGTRPGSSGGHYIRDCYVIGSGRYGMLLNAFDSLVIGCDVGASKEHGVVISANQTRVVGTKSWYSGRDLYQEGGIDVIGSGASSYDGFFITQPSPSGNNGIQMSGCQSQDNGRYGINFNGVSGVKVSGHMFGGDVVAAFRLGTGNAIALDGMLPQSDRGNTPVYGVCDGNASGCQLRLHFDANQCATNIFQFVNGGSFKQCLVEVYSGSGGVNNVGNVSGAQTPSALLARTWVYTFTGNGSIENARPAFAGQEIVFVVTAGANTVTWGTDYHSLSGSLPSTGSFTVRFVNVTMNSDTPYWVAVDDLILGHLADTGDAHDASAISVVDSGGYFTGTDVEAVLQELGAGGGSGAPTDAQYYVAASDSGLSAEIVVPAFAQSLLDDTTAAEARDTLAAAPGAAMDVLPSGAVAQSYPRWLGAANLTGVLISQKVNLYGLWLPKGTTVTSITFESGSTALASGVHQFFGLYDSSLGLLGTSADDTSTAWGANTPKTLALTSPFVTTYSGLHYVAILVQAGTMPTLNGFNSGNTRTIGLAPILGGESTGSLTALPATAGALTAKSNFPFFYLS